MLDWLLSWIVFMIWVGGMGPSYIASRKTGDGRYRSATKAFVWPQFIGPFIVKHLFRPEN